MTTSRKILAGVKNVMHAVGLDVGRVNSANLKLQRLEWLRSYGIQTVVDVGANTGQFAILVRKALPDAQIYSFEPIKECCNALMSRMRHDSRFRAFQIGLGDDEHEVSIHRNEFSPSSSLLPMSSLHREMFPFATESVVEPVTIRTLDSVMVELSIVRPVLLKIDVQGYEERVLRGASEFLFSTDVVLAEAGFEALYENQILFHEMYELLHARGFEFKGVCGQLLARTDGRPLQGDAIFVRTSPSVDVKDPRRE